MTRIDVPATGTGAYQGTLPYTINLAGEIIGIYIDASYVVHAFIRTP